MKIIKSKFAVIFFPALMLIFASCVKEAELGTKDNPVKFYFTPSVDSETITSNSQEFMKFMEKETGLFFKTAVPASYIAVVEAFGSKRADVAVMNSFGYLLANQKYGAKARLTVVRYGEKVYKGQIIVRTDSGINGLADLNGKNFAFTDASSTSGYLFPLKILNEASIKLANSVFAMKHDNVVTMVYQKQVDAGATFYSPPGADGVPRDARARVVTQFPDVFEKIKILQITDDILNDPFVFRKDLPEELSERIIAAIFKFIETEEGKKIFSNIYSVEGVAKATDSDYDGLRKMVEINKIDPIELMKEKK
ncbi:MAG: phosphonates-binding protein [Bdellovibrionales bacterium RIFOXYD12_FULL_39_22]|nr:MAG: phosphonates-binding protein [Bdellovibrionales bacterium RIFOXYB1_FULL_39_21]OFZ43742.1 MAG: phosphonates-binding protein [Bdellovibrionales bacterium RIFOXYC12_FULL_39_17]OFZ48087.1 MAG: phosphonates-binding protein [Bdellovibrionales bacterium RIFOXYC1_FULL_39_130]OFZ73777.1 MAG: phosphonates-binding protein [Bdellovibrionales bacterium RIFOXYC2_FULL_39_8]OFZ77250.1 MAG: phosphonates-binding protein [Bdellovibrionales bacterium RIFOXYD1_FULL_39_84]OFZ95690.1 MAG: phosphonates-bindin